MGEPYGAGPVGGRISYRQSLAMIIIMGLASTDILVPTVVASLSGRDAWLTVLLSTLLAALIVTLSFYLAGRMGERTLIQYSLDVLGRWAGGLVAMFFIGFLLFQAAMTIRSFRTFMLTVFYVKTPVLLVESVMALVIILAVRAGLELISRLNELLLPVGVAIMIFVGILGAWVLDLAEFQPVLEAGFAPVMSASLRLVVYLAQGALIYLMLYPYIKRGGGFLATALAVFSLGSMMLVWVMAIGVFGIAATSEMRFILLELVRNIDAGGVFRDPDALIMAVWYGGIIARLAILVYLACLGLSQWLGLKTLTPLLTPLLALLVAYNNLMFANPVEVVSFIEQVEPGLNLTALLFLPLVLLAATFIKTK